MLEGAPIVLSAVLMVFGVRFTLAHLRLLRHGRLAHWEVLHSMVRIKSMGRPFPICGKEIGRAHV